MPVSPVTPPVPPNSNLNRAMYLYSGGDPLGTDQKINSILTFCNQRGVNTLFLDIWNYLGGGNWSAAKLARMQLMVQNAHLSGIKVHAYAGNVDWGYLQQWVLKNIIQPYQKYQALASLVTQRFDAVHLDVEYWTDANQQASVACPQLCDLIRAIKHTTGDPVGCFAGFFLKDNTGSRPSFSYNGKTAQDGEFLMDAADYVVVGAYRNHAEDNQQDGPGQVSLFQPWYDYAKQVGKNLGLYCASETQNIQPAYTTYFGMTKAQMEAQHVLISQAFAPAGSLGSPGNAAFLGQAVDEYVSWAAMS